MISLRNPGCRALDRWLASGSGWLGVGSCSVSGLSPMCGGCQVRRAELHSRSTSMNRIGHRAGWPPSGCVRGRRRRIKFASRAPKRVSRSRERASSAVLDRAGGGRVHADPASRMADDGLLDGKAVRGCTPRTAFEAWAAVQRTHACLLQRPPWFGLSATVGGDLPGRTPQQHPRRRSVRPLRGGR